MILLCGIPTEEPLARVAAALDSRGARFAVFNQRAFADAEFSFRTDDAGLSGRLRLGTATFPIEDVTAAYTRLMDDQLLPELAAEPPDSARRHDCRALHDELSHWLELSPACVVNRSGPMATNCSKPYQAQLISACGFEVPETLVTNVPEIALDFWREHGRAVYKSTSSTRSIVRELDDDALSRLDRVRGCPVQFQALVEGDDTRVHVVGEEVFATRIISTSTDYRYTGVDDASAAVLEPTVLADELAGACVSLSRRLGLEFSGIDLRMTPDGRAVCFEVNTCPAFSYYESRTGQPIAAAVARHLCRDEA